jgi:hypothetical protein
MSDIVNDSIRAAAEEKEFSNLDYILESDPDPIEPGPSSRVSDLLPDLSILLSKTGPGPIEDYINHPMNFKQSKGFAQMLRGMTGIAGELDYAIIDIALGAFQTAKEKTNAAQPE